MMGPKCEGRVWSKEFYTSNQHSKGLRIISFNFHALAMLY